LEQPIVFLFNKKKVMARLTPAMTFHSVLPQKMYF